MNEGAGSRQVEFVYLVSILLPVVVTVIIIIDPTVLYARMHISPYTCVKCTNTRKHDT